MKILIFSFNDKLGDGLQKVSFIQYLKKIFPNSEITYTTTLTTTLKTNLNPLVIGCINNFIEYNQITSSPFNIVKKNYIFIEKKFDLIIDLQKVVIKTIQLKKINHKKFFSTSANFLFSDYKNDLKLDFKNIYIERFYFNILSLLKNQKINIIPNINIPFIKTPILTKNNKRKIGIAPGAGDEIRIWGFYKYLTIAKLLRDQGNQIYFFLGPDEKKYLDICHKNNFDCPEWENNIMKSNNILFTMNLAKQIDCLLCNDAGTAWIFEFSGVKTFKIFGVTNERKFSRPGFSETIQVKDYGYDKLQSFPVDLYKKLLDKFLLSL